MRCPRKPMDGEGPSWFLRQEGTWEQMREMFALRSIYHLKEADPHAWAIPRLSGQAKASFVAVEFDEFGGGRGDRVHQQLFADLMHAADLDTSYLGYLDRAPAAALVPVNLMTMFGLHRASRGATVGHLAATEITSSPGSRRLAEALQRLDAPQECAAFLPRARRGRRRPRAGPAHRRGRGPPRTGTRDRPDILLGMRAFGLVEDRLAEHMMESWLAGRSAIELR